MFVTDGLDLSALCRPNEHNLHLRRDVRKPESDVAFPHIVSIVPLQTGTKDEQIATQFLVSVRLSVLPIRYRGNECQPIHTHTHTKEIWQR